jgi:hypothetical protein
VIEEIRELMLKSTKEVVSKEKLNRGGPARVAGKQLMQEHRSTSAHANYSAHWCTFKEGRGANPLIFPSILNFKCN